MALVLKDRVKETTLTTGTGTITLAGASTGYQSFSVIGDGNTTYYCIAGQGNNEWEVGIGTYTAAGTTLARTTVLASSNSGSLVNFSSGTKDVFVTYPAGKSVYEDAIGEVTITTLNATNVDASDGAAAIAITNASGDVALSSTGALTISKGTTAQQPGTPAAGMLRFNTTTNEFEGYNGSAWASVGGSAISNDTATATNLYPAFVSATSGTALNIYTSNAKLLYKPSTGELQASEVVASNGIVVNSQLVTADYTIPSGSNAMSAGPVAVDTGITVTVSSGSVWVIV